MRRRPGPRPNHPSLDASPASNDHAIIAAGLYSEGHVTHAERLGLELVMDGLAANPGSALRSYTTVKVAAAGRLQALQARLAALEAVFVDPHRESSRDVLRNPGGLADTLDDLISVVAIADAAPTDSAQALSQQAIERVGEQLAQLDALLAGELPALNAQLAAAGVTVLGA